MRYIDAGRSEGAKALTGGERLHPVTGGCYIGPTVFDRVSNEMTIAREEIFGPVLSVIRFRTEDEALARANASRPTACRRRSGPRIFRARTASRAALRAGTVHVNQYDEDDMTVPFGGYKQSGNGRDKSLHALEKYTELKTTWIRL